MSRRHEGPPRRVGQRDSSGLTLIAHTATAEMPEHGRSRRVSCHREAAYTCHRYVEKLCRRRPEAPEREAEAHAPAAAWAVRERRGGVSEEPAAVRSAEGPLVTRMHSFAALRFLQDFLCLCLSMVSL